MSSLDIEQGSDAWRKIRLGKVTASRVADVVARTKSGPSASRANYLAELICERLTGVAVEGFTNSAMQWGTDQEPRARELYEFIYDCAVEQVGFVHHPLIDASGSSPDGLVGESGLVEIKAPNSATHIETLLSEKIPAKYQTQMQWQMACDPTRLWCDFVSFDPRLPADMQLFVKRLDRDDALIADLEKEVRAFLAEVDAKIAALTEKFARAA
jgi:putative phage-type endonuclease